MLHDKQRKFSWKLIFAIRPNFIIALQTNLRLGKGEKTLKRVLFYGPLPHAPPRYKMLVHPVSPVFFGFPNLG